MPIACGDNPAGSRFGALQTPSRILQSSDYPWLFAPERPALSQTKPSRNSGQVVGFRWLLGVHMRESLGQVGHLVARVGQYLLLGEDRVTEAHDGVVDPG